MVDIKKDSKSDTYIVTTTDKEGFHRQLNLTEGDLMDLAQYAITVLDRKITLEK